MVGLIIPIALAPGSVNQRLPSGPVVIACTAPPDETATAREGELGDRGNAREQATIFQPFEPEPLGSGRSGDGLGLGGRPGTPIAGNHGSRTVACIEATWCRSPSKVLQDLGSDEILALVPVRRPSARARRDPLSKKAI